MKSIYETIIIRSPQEVENQIDPARRRQVFRLEAALIAGQEPGRFGGVYLVDARISV